MANCAGRKSSISQGPPASLTHLGFHTQSNEGNNATRSQSLGSCFGTISAWFPLGRRSEQTFIWQSHTTYEMTAESQHFVCAPRRAPPHGLLFAGGNAGTAEPAHPAPSDAALVGGDAQAGIAGSGRDGGERFPEVRSLMQDRSPDSPTSARASIRPNCRGNCRAPADRHASHCGRQGATWFAHHWGLFALAAEEAQVSSNS